VDAGVSLQAVLDDPECPPIFHQLLTGSVSWQVRNETTVHRALASPRVAPQWVAALLALGAMVQVDGAEISLETLLQDKVEGTMSALKVGVKGKRSGQAHVARTPADEPIVAVVAAVEMDGTTVRQARVAITGVWPEIVRLAEAPARLMGEPLDKERIRDVAAAVEAEVAPKGDFRGSEEYRSAMAGVLARRALEQCLRQEVGDE
jgi:CO/xanthine dehydrogenase FAD-binding subunit